MSAYKVFTKKFDEVLTGYELAKRRIKALWRMDEKIQSSPTHTMFLPPEEVAKREAHTLSIKDKQPNAVQIEQAISQYLQYGRQQVLDSHSLTMPSNEIEISDDVAVSVLFDLSGSSRGKPALRMFALADAFMRHAARSQTSLIEMNAFTTVEWKGGQSREKWLAGDRPQQPGRLNDLLMVQLSEFGKPIAPQTYKNLATFFPEGALKENIDGESIEWAAQRLKAQPQSKKYC